MGILDTNHSSCCGIVKYYPKFLPVIVLYALLCKKTPFISSVHAQVVNKDSPCLTLLLTEFIRPSCYQPLRVIEYDGYNPPPFSILHHGSPFSNSTGAAGPLSGAVPNSDASHRPLL